MTQPPESGSDPWNWQPETSSPSEANSDPAPSHDAPSGRGSSAYSPGDAQPPNASTGPGGEDTEHTTFLSTPVSSDPGHGNPPPYRPSPAFGQSEPSSYGQQPTTGFPPASGGYTPPTGGSSGYGQQPTTSFTPPPGGYAQPPAPGYTPPNSSYNPPAGGYGQPSGSGGYGQPSGSSGYGHPSPYGAQSGAGNGPTYPPVGPTYPPAGPSYPGGSGGSSGGRNNKLIPGIIAAVVVAALALGGFFVFHNKNSDSSKKSPSISASTTESAFTFPSTTDAPTSAVPTTTAAPTTTTSRPTTAPRTTPKVAAATADQKAAASVAARYYHALAADDHSTFCSLADPTSMKTRLKKLKISTCNELGLKAQYRKQFASFTVTDPTKISVYGASATMTSSAFTPKSFIYFIVLLKKVSGKWKVATV